MWKWLTFGKDAPNADMAESQALLAAVTKSLGFRSQVMALGSVIIPASVALSQK